MLVSTFQTEFFKLPIVRIEHFVLMNPTGV